VNDPVNRAARDAFVADTRARSGRVLAFPERPLDEPDDPAIARMLLDGDRRASRAVWNRFWPMVRGMLGRTFGPAQDTDDLVQEVFLVLFDRAHTLREPRALRAFVISITAHTIRRELRRKAAARWFLLGETRDAPARDADIDSREALTRLYRILDRLGSDERLAFVLRFFEGLELVDVAQATGVSLTTTKRRVAHAWERVVFHAQRDEALVGFLSEIEGALP
jgi:RNA polymerase sigma-70 factor, ECF subfamily